MVVGGLTQVPTRPHVEKPGPTLAQSRESYAGHILFGKMTTKHVELVKLDLDTTAQSDNKSHGPKPQFLTIRHSL